MSIKPHRGGAETRSSAYHVAIAALSLLTLAFSLLWAVVMPPFTGPDEYAHYNSVTRLVAGDGWPRPYDARIEKSTIQAVAESGGSYLDQRLEALPDPTDRALLLEGDDWERQARDQMVQHPPLYYGAVAAVVWAAGGEELRWDQAQMIMRSMSALMLACSIPFVVGIARRVTSSRVAGLVGGAAVLLVPYFTNSGGFVNNDNLLVVACAAATYFAIRGLGDRERAIRYFVWSGAALGVALLTKGLALMLIPVIALIAVRSAWLASGLLRKAALVATPMLVAFVIGGWWWARNLIILGRVQPSILGGREPIGNPAEGYDFWFFVGNAVVRFNRSFWGRGSRPEFALPELVADLAGLGFVVALVVAVVVARRRALLLSLWLFPALVVATTVVNAHRIFWDLGRPAQGIQGRYVFAGIAALAATIAVLFAWIVRRHVGRGVRALAVVGVVLAPAPTWAGLWWVYARVWNGEPAQSLALAHGVPTGWIVLLMVAAMAAHAVLGIAAARSQGGGNAKAALPRGGESPRGTRSDEPTSAG